MWAKIRMFHGLKYETYYSSDNEYIAIKNIRIECPNDPGILLLIKT